MAKPLRTLIVEDSENDAELLLRALRRSGYEPFAIRVQTPVELAAALDQHTWDVVIADYAMPHFTGLDALKLLQSRGIDVPFIIVSGSIGEDIAVEAMRCGAHDYIMKNNPARLIPAIEREIKEAQVRRERRRAEERVRYLAYYDPLTDLPNRAQLNDYLEQLVAREGREFVLLVLCLNYFRDISITLGHHYGDVALKEAGERVRAHLRPSDMAARLGAHEFAVLLNPADREHATGVARALLNALENPFEIAGFALTVGPNIGIAQFPQDGSTPQLLLRHADIALSMVKNKSGGFAFYDAARDPSSPRQLALMSDLRTAIEERQLFLHFQPKLEMSTGEVAGVEALARWRHAQHGLVPPDQFVPLAEKTGLINALTLRVLEAAVTQSRAWRQQGWEIPIAVNISAKDLLDEALIEKMRNLLAGDGPAGMIELEITETAIMEDPANALTVLSTLADMGVRLYIDDFGTGYSSLGYLRRLPISAVKIDKSFIVDVSQDADAASIVHSIIELAHHLGLKVVSEGVEDRASWDHLAGLGCDQAQGYYISRPVPPEDLSAWLRRSARRFQHGQTT